MQRLSQFFSSVVLMLLSALPLSQAQDLGSDYDVQTQVLIASSDGATVSAIVVRKKSANVPLPTVLGSVPGLVEIRVVPPY